MAMSKRIPSIFEHVANLEVAERNKNKGPSQYPMALHFYREISDNFPFYVDQFDAPFAIKVRDGLINGLIEMAIIGKNDEEFGILKGICHSVNPLLLSGMLIKLYSAASENEKLNSLKKNTVKAFYLN